ncbi:MAG: hypothetical protein A2W19_17260 [Spirochaetes bacterium RBG_16_49_21]|nr:MAG: hypothetical protein A2W19_17260 [Spirochaetes bacterium RBG_16_49_21]
MNTDINQSSLIRFLVGRFDFIIRLFYSKMRFYKLFNFFLPRLHSSDFESLDRYFHIITGELKKQGFSIRGKSVLEIGPGNSHINAYNFLLNGCRKVIFIDKHPRFFDTGRQRSFMRDEIRYFKSKYRVKKFEYINEDTGALNPSYMEFIAGGLPAVAFPGKVDFIYSIAVLHHIKDLERYIRKMHEILNKDGMMYHVIDLKDKFHFFGNPFLFYKYSDFVWENFLTEETLTYTNRIRYREYVDLFTRYGFKIVWEKTVSHDFPVFKINKKFAGRSDLHIGDAHFLLEKV